MRRMIVATTAVLGLLGLDFVSVANAGNAISGCEDTTVTAVDAEAWTETIEHDAVTHEESVMVVDQEAWTETIEHPQVSHEQKTAVVDEPAWTETVVIEHEAVTREGTTTVVDEPARTETIGHDAVTHQESVTVIDEPAWTEIIEHPAVSHEETITVVDEPASTETVLTEAAHWQRYSWTRGARPSDNAPTEVPPNGDWQPNVKADPHGIGVAGPYFRSTGATDDGSWYYLDWVEAETETIKHDAVTHEETLTVVDKEAWTETIEHDAVTHEESVTVDDQEAWTETVEHPQVSHEQKTTVVDRPAWTETVVIEHEAVTHEETVVIVDEPAWTESIEHDAVTRQETITVIDEPARTEAIHHPAITHDEPVEGEDCEKPNGPTPETPNVALPGSFGDLSAASRDESVPTVNSRCVGNSMVTEVTYHNGNSWNSSVAGHEACATGTALGPAALVKEEGM